MAPILVRRVLVTGGQRGLGRAIACKLLREYSDCNVIIGALERELPVAREVVESLLQENPDFAGRVEVVPLDVTDDVSVSRAAERVASKYGRDPPPLYGIVNNAGVGGGTMARVLQVNVGGQWRVCNAFVPLLNPAGGRIVNIASGAAPWYLMGCSLERRRQFTNPNITWEQIVEIMNEVTSLATGGLEAKAALKAKGFFSKDPGGNPYGVSKALVNSFTLLIAGQYPNLVVNSCTPGNTLTPMTQHQLKRTGKAPEELGLQPPELGARCPCFLMMGEHVGHGWYYGSDSERSPMDVYRTPFKDPPYRGELAVSKL